MSLRVDLPTVWHGVGNFYSVHFVIIFSLGTLGVSHLALSWDLLHRTAGAQHLVLKLARRTLGGDPGGSAERQAARFAARTQSAERATLLKICSKWVVNL